MNDLPKPDYFQEAVRLPFHRALLLAGAIASAAALFRGHWWVLLVFLAIEIGFLLLVPLSPGFRRKVDAENAEEKARLRALELEKIVYKLSPNARSRFDGIARQKGKILDALRSLGPSRALEQEWAPRLDHLAQSAIRILVAVDSTRADDRDHKHLQSQIKELEAELAKASDGPAREARAQRLELLQKRAAAFGLTREQRDTAIVQLETIEDLLQEMLTRGLAGRDAAAFGQRVSVLSAQIEGAAESIKTLDRHAEIEAELARR